MRVASPARHSAASVHSVTAVTHACSICGTRCPVVIYDVDTGNSRSGDHFNPISCGEDRSMMANMPGHNKCHGSGGSWMLVNTAHSLPSGIVQMAEHENMAPPKLAEFFNQLRQWIAVVPRRRCVIIFIEAGQRKNFSSGDAKGTVSKNSLSIDNVAKHFPYAPFARRISESRPLFT